MRKTLTVSLLAVVAACPAWAQHRHGGGAGAGGDAAPRGESASAPGMAGIGGMGGGRGMGKREWTRYPLLVGRPAGQDRSVALIKPRGIGAPAVTVYAADGPAERRKADYPVGENGARIEAVAPRTGNYHWVVAREESVDTVRVASTAWYFSNPGDAPTSVLAQAKHELEIVPQPLPREHRSYREAEKWRFLVRFHGQPLTAQPLAMETEAGSRTTATTDADGIATVVFPRDVKTVKEGEEEGGNPRARTRFVLATEKDADGKHYLTAFNYSYTQDPERNRSLGWGAAFGVLGMVAATPLLRRRAVREGDQNHA